MQDKEIKIRLANSEDRDSIFNWRIDKLSREMSFDSSVPTLEEHSNWFKEALKSKHRKLYIGEVNFNKIGICRFDFNYKELYAEVSINTNPEMRSLGLGKRFLFQCIEYYLKSNNHELLAKIKLQNKASLKIFEYAGFKEDVVRDNIIFLRKPIEKITFKKVDENDIEILFQLLNQRKYSISHKDSPTMSEHLKFVKSNDYLYWSIIYENKIPFGAFYIQNNNSIGLNLLKNKKSIIFETLRHIKLNFIPQEEIKSKVPPYFYLNVAYENEELKKILIELENFPIQTSFMLSKNI